MYVRVVGAINSNIAIEFVNITRKHYFCLCFANQCAQQAAMALTVSLSVLPPVEQAAVTR